MTIHETMNINSAYNDLHWRKWWIILLLLNWDRQVLCARYQEPYLHSYCIDHEFGVSSDLGK